MGKINILSEEICTRIAAGEVIERPYSAVKEMVENSIDAGATEIEVYIEDGGKSLIKIVDNGCGIEKDDLRAAFIPHATSKISKLEDIDHIHTLGFRGEALATIGSIADVELVSAVEGQPAYRVRCEGDYPGSVEPAVGPKGTQITVTKFFFNTPVRAKFLKTDKKEATDITTFMARFILGRPDISFKYYVDGKLTLQSYGGGLEEAIAQVYGANALSQCFKINAERNDIKIRGFISNQNYFKPNKTYQNTYINGRHVQNQVISGAITNAYSAYAMKRQYPFYVLFLEMADDVVDINVHPNKSDVRFIDNSLIYGTVYKVISSILDGSAQAAEYVVEQSSNETPPVFAAEYNVTEKIHDKDFNDVEGIEKYIKKPAPQKPQATSGIDYSVYESYEAPAEIKVKKELDPYDFKYPFAKKDDVNFGQQTYGLGAMNSGFSAYEQAEMLSEKIKKKQLEVEQCLKQSKYCGTLFNTYIMYERGNEVYVIDQHAAHERLIYDEIKQKLIGVELPTQDMLVPYELITNAEEHEFIEAHKKDLTDMGFRWDCPDENTYSFNCVPAALQNINIKEFFDEFLSRIGEIRKITYIGLFKDKIAQSACKHAVKGGDSLTEQERDQIFKKLSENMDMKCPHGRPVCLKVSKFEIEKLFKRKV